MAIGGYWWLLGANLLVAIGGFLFMAIDGYSIHGY